MVTLNVGPREYRLVEGWGQLPAGWIWGQVGGVAVDSQDNVHVFTRTEHPYMVFDKNGKLLESWGHGIFNSAHGICIAPDDSVFFIDVMGHQVLKFDKNGKHQFTIGSRDQPSDTGWQDEAAPASPGAPTRNGVDHVGPPFHRPTDLSIAENGDFFVSDGYRNARVHKFSADGTLLKSWGEVGHATELRDTKDGPGKFHLVHGVWTHAGKVYVSDRANNRIHLFTTEGEFLDIWTGFALPTKIWMDREEVIYVSELEDRFSVVNLDGTLIGHGGKRGERSNEPGKFWGPHGIWGDSSGALYVAEVLNGARVQKFERVK